MLSANSLAIFSLRYPNIKSCPHLVQLTTILLLLLRFSLNKTCLEASSLLFIYMYVCMYVPRKCYLFISIKRSFVIDKNVWEIENTTLQNKYIQGIFFYLTKNFKKKKIFKLICLKKIEKFLFQHSRNEKEIIW